MRVIPRMPTQNYRTFKVISPLSTHFRRATCEEAGCLAYRNGWTIPKASLDPYLLKVIKDSRKHYSEKELTEGGEKYLVFPPGQACFQTSEHRISLERPEIYYAGRGDFRSFTTRRAHMYDRADQWQHDFAEHQARNYQLAQRG